MKYKCDYCGKETDNIRYIDLYNGEKLECHRCTECDDLLSRQIDWESDNEHLYESNIICPYCDYEFDDYDSYSYMDEGECEIECPVCGKKFKLEIQQIIEFSTHKIADDMPNDCGLDESDE